MLLITDRVKTHVEVMWKIHTNDGADIYAADTRY